MMPRKTGALLDPSTASEFIEGYKRYLLTVETADRDDEGGILETLVGARRRITGDPALLRDMLADARKITPGLGDPVLAAIGTLRVENWVYLKDTRSYAVFMNSSGEFAFGVRALTQRIRDIVGTSGVMLETGIVRHCGQYVCDGLVSRVVYLGRNYLRSFTGAYERSRTEGRFEVEY
jgi:hypothetical protein